MQYSMTTQAEQTEHVTSPCPSSSFVAAEIRDATSCEITPLRCSLGRLNLGFTTVKNSVSCFLRNSETETGVSALCTCRGRKEDSLKQHTQCPHHHSVQHGSSVARHTT